MRKGSRSRCLGRSGSVLAKRSTFNYLQDRQPAQTAGARFGVNNAGNSQHIDFDKVTEADFDAVVNVHFKGVYFLTQRLLPLINDGGRIVNIWSGPTRISVQGSSPVTAPSRRFSGPPFFASLRDTGPRARIWLRLHSPMRGDRLLKVRHSTLQYFPRGDEDSLCLGLEQSTASGPEATQVRSGQGSRFALARTD